jgi:hypothetical protein
MPPPRGRGNNHSTAWWAEGNSLILGLLESSHFRRVGAPAVKENRKNIKQPRQQAGPLSDATRRLVIYHVNHVTYHFTII